MAETIRIKSFTSSKQPEPSTIFKLIITELRVNTFRDTAKHSSITVIFLSALYEVRYIIQ